MNDSYDDEHANSFAGSDVEDTENKVKFIPSYVVIAIDCHESMFVKREDGTMPFRDCLQACYNLADSLILASSWTPFAVVLAKREVEFLDFKDNMLDITKTLKSKFELSDEKLREQFLRDYKLEYPNFFLKCKKIFHNTGTSYLGRYLFFVTNDPNPAISDKTEKYQAIAEAKTFSDSDIKFEVLSTSDNFEYGPFYKEMYSAMDTNLVEEICKDADELFDKFSRYIVPKEWKMSTQFYPFKDDPEVNFSCILFCPVRQISGPSFKKLTRDGKMLKQLEEQVDNYEPEYKVKDLKSDTLKEKLCFKKFEAEGAKESCLKLGFHLLYVSKRITEVGASLGTNLVQEDPKKPSEYFKKFWQKCVDTDRVLVCLRKMTCIDDFRYVEMIPVMIDKKPTFLVQQIPYGTEILYPKKCPEGYPEKEQDPQLRQVIEELVEKLSFDFDVTMIPDTELRRIKSYLKAKMLDSEVLEDDTSTPVIKEKMDEALGDIPDQLNNILDISKDIDSRKRKGGFKAQANKRRK